MNIYRQRYSSGCLRRKVPRNNPRLSPATEKFRLRTLCRDETSHSVTGGGSSAKVATRFFLLFFFFLHRHTIFVFRSFPLSHGRGYAWQKGSFVSDGAPKILINIETRKYPVHRRVMDRGGKLTWRGVSSWVINNDIYVKCISYITAQFYPFMFVCDCVHRFTDLHITLMSE